MHWIRCTRGGCLLLFCLTLPLPAQAITIDVDFESGTLFSPSIDAQAKSTIAAAAADISAAITSSLNAVPTDVYTGVNGNASVTFNWNASYPDPDTRGTITQPNATLAADTVKVFVGTANHSGQTLAEAFPYIGLDPPIVNLGGGPASDWPGALANAEAQSEAAYLRGGSSPVIGSISGGGPVGGVTANFSADFGVTFGSVSFDVDQDNDGSKDTAAELNNYWHWRHDTPVAAGKTDLYSVALHEIVHTLGIGSSVTWNNFVSGATWNGPEVLALTGSGAGLIDTDGSHVANGLLSKSISDGTLQEVLMAPSFFAGVRRELTLLDLAFLRDIGFDTINPTFPPDYDGDGDVDGADLAVLRNAYGNSANGDADNDGDTDGADFLIWQRQYTGPLVLTAAATVPEPSTMALLITMLALTRLRLREPITW
ncbi:MAG: hypothetical protein MI725_01500 [Pirellulales bacterium]|nr:hypothetical protein [Pirellulales bacterium]